MNTATANSHRNSGIRSARSREAKRLSRDRKIFAFLRKKAAEAEEMHRFWNEPVDRLSVWLGKRNWGDQTLTPFPIVSQPNGRSMPMWNDLSHWMKVQVITFAYLDDFLTFNINIHPKLEAQWVSEGRDIAKVMRDRLRKELDKEFSPGREFMFVLEGWSANHNGPTYLHIHGGAAVRAIGDGAKVASAAGRAAGHGLRGFTPVRRAIHTREFEVCRAAYANYLFKAARRSDPRLTKRRLVMSQQMTYTARLFWESITRTSDKWRYDDYIDDQD